MISARYLEMCPQCGGDLSTEEIERNLCFSRHTPLDHSYLKNLSDEFERFFEERTGFAIRSLQRMWARRVLAGYSFAAIAPTGIGKTMFGAVMAAFLAERGKRSYLIVPTTLLLDEVRDRLEKMNVDFAYYHGRMKSHLKDEMKERIENGEYNILLTTTAFLSRNFSLLKGKKFHFVFVDDVDSLLKRSKNLEKVISIIHERSGVLMVSTATGTRGYNTKILREKLNFDVGNVRNTVRNVEDIYARKEDFGRIVEIMGGGALIFVSRSDLLEEVTSLLPKGTFGVVTAESKEAFRDFEEGKIEFLVGIASPYGSLVRGIDMPERIRYAIFYEIPQFSVSARDVDKLSEKALTSLAHALSVLDADLRTLAERRELDEIRRRIKAIAERDVFQEDVVIENGRIIIPDVRTYIQASGRTSRLYSGGITKGASFILDREERIKLFEKRARFFDIELKRIDEVDLESLRREIDEDRERIRKSREVKEVVEPLLLIVESPNKAKHISAFFGKPNRRIMGNAIIYEVSTGNRVLLIAPSLGHVVDLTTRRGFHGVEVRKNSFVPVYTAIKKCRDCGYQFTDSSRCPICGSENIYDSKDQINVLRQLAFETGNVLIGTDPDTEGEKIAWDLYNLLSPFASSIRRGEFHEVTRKAIMRAMEDSREINENLVKAQIVRRIEDRWIGFEFSQILMRRFRERNLSAGRAQTPVLGWIISRYRESREKKKAWFIEGTNVMVPWSGEVVVESHLLEEEVRERRIPPYTTDAALRDINAVLRIGSREAMNSLQRLFEMGLITYHRTDSTHVSDEGLKIARIFLGEDFEPKRWGESGAHECIRPTKPMGGDDLRRYIKEGMLKYDLSEEDLKIYDLVFRRFMASQTRWQERVRRYELIHNDESVEVEITVEAWGRGYELYPYGTRVHSDIGEGRIKLRLEERIVSPKPYTQGELIGEMKSRGIGRPSTYATIIDKLFRREYIFEKRGFLIPTRRGIRVHSFLSSNYSKFLSEERTRLLEEKMDSVERGERDYQDVLRELYREMAEIRER